MSDLRVKTACLKCGAPIDTSLDAPEVRRPCPTCGKTLRSHDVALHLSAGSARVGLEVKAKRPGGKKPHVELKIGPSFSRRLQKPVEHKRLIDRGNDVYIEEVTDYETAERIHETNEPLSLHIGHGSAKGKDDA